jgi:hypothetical protein
MGTFARRNGRPMAAAVEGRPSCDAARLGEVMVMLND